MRSRTPPIPSEFGGGGLNLAKPAPRYATGHHRESKILCASIFKKAKRVPCLKMIMNFAATVAEKCKQTSSILNIIAQYMHPVISHSDIYQLLHVLAPKCHHQRDIIPKMFKPTCQARFCSSFSKRN